MPLPFRITSSRGFSTAESSLCHVEVLLLLEEASQKVLVFELVRDESVELGSRAVFDELN